MAVPLPIKSTWTRTINADSTITFNITITDGNNVVIDSAVSPPFEAGTSFAKLVQFMNNVVRNALNRQFTVADIPASGSIQYGFPAAVRPVDGLVG